MRTATPPIERFMKFVNQTESCWLWTGALNHRGYGAFRFGGSTMAHRAAHEFWKGPIPEGFEVDHLCAVKACVRPSHIEAVTKQENIRRYHATRVCLHCNGELTQRGRQRVCRPCRRAWDRNRYHQRKAQVSA